MRGSIFWRTFGGHLVVIALLTAALGFSTWHLIKGHSFELLEGQLEDVAWGLVPSVKDLLGRQDLHGLNDFVRTVGEKTGVRITVVDPQGVVLADSEEDPSRMENHADRPEIRQAMRGKVGSSLRLSPTLGEEMLYVAVPTEVEGEKIVVRTSFFLRDVEGFLGAFRRRLFGIALAFGLFALFYAYLSSRRLSRPIKEMATATSRVAQGDFDVRVPPRGGGEVAELARHFNEMAERLKRAFEENRRRREEVEGILKALQDPLLVIGPEGRVQMANEKAQELLGREIVGRSFWELGPPTLRQAVSRARKEPLSEEVEVRDGVFLLSTGDLPASGQTLVLMHEITHLRKMEEVKRDLVASVSHELRTPLTAIKGFLEALDGEREEEARSRYLTIVRRHVERLANLVEDLLLLSELESKEVKLDLKELDLEELVRGLLPPFEHKAQEKGLRLSVDVPKGLKLTADPFRLEQLLFNLLDNALKYTDKGEVRIRARYEDGEVLIEVADTGIGIPPEHLPRVFERFYVVDKSRSRRLGGTGLGLSIVKHIVLLHGGKIDVESAPRKGTRFTVRLPLNLTSSSS